MHLQDMLALLRPQTMWLTVLLIRLAPNSYRPMAALGGPTLGSCCCRSSCGNSTLVSSRLQAATQTRQ